MEVNNYRIFGTDKSVENTTIVRRTLTDEENAYCSILGYFPSYKCNFNLHYENFTEKFKIANEIYKSLIENGFTTFNITYSNGKNYDGDFDVGDNNIISNEISMNSFIVFKNNCLLSFGNDWCGYIIMSHESIDIIKKTINDFLSKYIKEDDKVRCNIIANERSGFFLEDFEIKVKGDIDYDLYNEGFEDVNKEIIRSIKEDDNGLYILHGDAGTGKTTYIRHLIKQLKENKKFVYVPSNLVNDLTSPNFISFVLGNKNCIFIIEDCENLVVTKDNMRSSAVADMLNMTDGILADALKIKFICTFNTNEKNIDEALLRPGRCRMKYDFEKLKKDRAIKAAQKLGLKIPNKDISLAELFVGENKFIEEKKKIGF